MSKLTHRHQAFIEEYLVNGMNGTQAYMSVYPKASERTAGENSFKLLKNTEIQAAIQEARDKTAEKLMVTKESLIQDLLTIKEMNVDNPRGGFVAIKAIEVINKMLGWNEAEKQDITMTAGITWNETKSYPKE